MIKSDFWERLKTTVVEVSSAAADFTEEQAVVGKLKFDILNLNRKIDRHKLDIGTKVLELSRTAKGTNPLENGEVRKKIALIDDVEKQIEHKKAEITKAVEEIRNRRKPAQKPAESAKPAPAPTKPKGKPAPKKADNPKAEAKSTAPKKAAASKTKSAAVKEKI